MLTRRYLLKVEPTIIANCLDFIILLDQKLSVFDENLIVSSPAVLHRSKVKRNFRGRNTFIVSSTDILELIVWSEFQKITIVFCIRDHCSVV